MIATVQLNEEVALRCLVTNFVLTCISDDLGWVNWHWQIIIKIIRVSGVIFVCGIAISPASLATSDQDILYSGQKEKANGPEVAKYFSLLKGVHSFLHHCIQFWQKKLSHYYRKQFICNSRAVNFLFLTNVVRQSSIIKEYIPPWGR